MSNTNPTPNGKDIPPSLERHEWRIGQLEGELLDVRQQLGLVTPIAESMVRFQRNQDRLLRALGINPDSDGPPPDITGQLRALAARDAELAARDAELAAGIEGAKKEGWHKLAASVGDIAKVGGKWAAIGTAGIALGWSLRGAILDLVEVVKQLVAGGG